MSSTKVALANGGLHEYFKCLIVSDTRKAGQVTMGTISFQFCPVDPILMIS